MGIDRPEAAGVLHGYERAVAAAVDLRRRHEADIDDPPIGRGEDLDRPDAVSGPSSSVTAAKSRL